MNPFADRLYDLGDESAFKVGDEVRRIEAQGRSVVRLNIGEPDFDAAPAISDAAIAQIRKGDAHYSDPQGILPLREAIAAVVSETKGRRVEPERVVVTSGGKPVIGYTFLTYVNPGDEVIHPAPGFPMYRSWLNYVGAVSRPIRLREERQFRLDLEELEALLSPRTKLLILNSPSNPTGSMLSLEDLGSMAELIGRKADPHLRILSDDVYDSIVFDGLRQHSIMSMAGMEEKTILLNSFSKTYAMTGWRLGYAVLPTAEEARRFKQWNINTYSCVAPFVQQAGIVALTDPAVQRHVVAMREAFQRRRDVVVPVLNEIPGISCVMPAGAFYAYPNVSGACEKLGISDVSRSCRTRGLPESRAASLFRRFALSVHRVATLDGPSFGDSEQDDRSYLRLSLASDEHSLREGLKRLESAAQDHSGFRSFAESLA